jgi:DNA-binding transcriptional ArsR family regulator
MSRKQPERKPETAAIFAALGDETRLALVRRLGAGEASSIVQLTAGSRLTRQAVTKHLRVLERAGLVRCMRQGRESHYSLDPKPLLTLQEYLDKVSAQWDQALARLQAMVEE